jgi:hypothetical protein
MNMLGSQDPNKKLDEWLFRQHDYLWDEKKQRRRAIISFVFWAIIALGGGVLLYSLWSLLH